MKTLLSLIFIALSIATQAQDSTIDDIVTDTAGVIIVQKDPRLEILTEKEIELNEQKTGGIKAAKGFRLMLLNTNNRQQAMDLRSKLLQRYPDQKVYMSFQPPYIKLKFGDYTDKLEAEKYKAELLKNKIISGNIYILPEIVAVKRTQGADNSDEE